MFETVYEWAGEYRRVDTSRYERDGTGAAWCSADYVPKQLERRFAKIRETVRPGLTVETFSGVAGDHLNEVNAIHAFLDGNGRAQRQLLVAMGEASGHRIDLSRIDAKAWNHASMVGFHTGDERPLATIVAGCVVGTERERPLGRDAKVLVTRGEVSAALAAIRGEREPGASASPATRVMATSGHGVSFLTFSRGERPDVPGDRLTGAVALAALDEGFGRGRYRSIGVDVELVDPGLLGKALRQTEARRAEVDVARVARTGARSPGRETIDR